MASPWKTPAFLLLFLPLGTLLGARADAAVDDRDANAVYDPALYQAMEFRSIGPYRRGRVTAVTGVPLEPDTFYMGSTGGGVWKTTNSGLDWANVSDGFFGRGTGELRDGHRRRRNHERKVAALA